MQNKTTIQSNEPKTQGFDDLSFQVRKLLKDYNYTAEFDVVDNKLSVTFYFNDNTKKSFFAIGFANMFNTGEFSHNATLDNEFKFFTEAKTLDEAMDILQRVIGQIKANPEINELIKVDRQSQVALAQRQESPENSLPGGAVILNLDIFRVQGDGLPAAGR